MFTAQQVREIVREWGTIPDRIPGYEEFSEYCRAASGEWWLNRIDNGVPDIRSGPTISKVLILTPKPKKYRFIAEEKPRLLKKDDWYWAGTSWERCIGDEFYGCPHYLCARREEVTE